jgi:hypothetical protein
MPTHSPDPDGDKLIAFYSGIAPDSRGRLLADVWALGIDELERSHDYIQWVFPLYEVSRAQPNSPVLSPRAAEVIRGSDDMRERLVRSAEVMAFFYGFAVVRQGDAWTVVLADNFESHSRHWLMPGNHNYLRHTRIMKSLTILGLAPLARAWFECLDGVFKSNQRAIGAEAHRYWASALPGA